MDQTCRKRYFRSKTEKFNIVIGFRIFKSVSWYQISALTDNFDFLTRFAQKGFFWSKTEKVNTTYFIHNSAYSNWFGAKFQLKRTILIFWTKFTKKGISSRRQNSEHQHGIVHIWIILGTKFQLKLIILSFWTKFTQQRYFQLKTEQAVQGLQAFAFCIVNVNSTVVFKHFEDFDLIFFNCYLAAPQPTLHHYQGDSLTHLMFQSLVFYIFEPKVTGSLVKRLGS